MRALWEPESLYDGFAPNARTIMQANARRRVGLFLASRLGLSSFSPHHLTSDQCAGAVTALEGQTFETLRAWAKEDGKRASAAMAEMALMQQAEERAKFSR
ncbi:MAG: hypothetical protein AB7F96_15460 [Beijerinckiaceae bacterium]